MSDRQPADLQSPEEFRRERRRQEEERLARLRTKPTLPVGRDGYAAASGRGQDGDWSDLLSRPSYTARSSSSYGGGLGGFLIGLVVSLGLALLVRALTPLIARWMDLQRGIALLTGAVLGILLGAFAVPRIAFPEDRGTPELVLGSASRGEVVAVVVAVMFAMFGGIGILIASQAPAAEGAAAAQDPGRTADPAGPEDTAGPEDPEVTPRVRLTLPDRAGWARILDGVDLVALATASLSVTALLTASFFFAPSVTVAEYVQGVQVPGYYDGPVPGAALLVCALAVGVHIAADVSSATLRGRRD